METDKAAITVRWQKVILSLLTIAFAGTILFATLSKNKSYSSEEGLVTVLHSLDLRGLDYLNGVGAETLSLVDKGNDHLHEVEHSETEHAHHDHAHPHTYTYSEFKYYLLGLLGLCGIFLIVIWMDRSTTRLYTALVFTVFGGLGTWLLTCFLEWSNYYADYCIEAFEVSQTIQARMPMTQVLFLIGLLVLGFVWTIYSRSFGKQQQAAKEDFTA